MRETDRAGHLRRKYGITEEQYEELLETQGHSCGVCGKHESTFPVRLAVDHNHRTGEVRGLLCNYCNHRLVGRHTDADLILTVSEYLRKGTGWFVPKKKRRRVARAARAPRKERTSRGKTARSKRPNTGHRMEAN
jgi:hypothetical protein